MTVDLGIAGVSEAVEIGAGGFGVVYRAQEDDLGRTVAVKILSSNLDEGSRYRFERERRAMGRLSGHPNIVTIYRGGYTERGNAYLVMEYLERGSLADRLSQRGPVPWEDALAFGVQLAGALETSHRAGVLHRDIKPANILLSRLGNTKLCDFGIARLHGALETQSAVVTASLAHAPPDIVSGQRPDARSDVYSLASTIYELVAGGAPFVRPTDESMLPILARIAQEPVPVLDEARLPGTAMRAIEQAMAKDPAARPATAEEFAEILVAVQQELGVTPTPIPIESVSNLEPVSDFAGIPLPDNTGDPLPPPVAQSPHQPGTGQPTAAGTGPPPTPTPAAGPTEISVPLDSFGPPVTPDTEGTRIAAQPATPLPGTPRPAGQPATGAIARSDPDPSGPATPRTTGPPGWLWPAVIVGSLVAVGLVALAVIASIGGDQPEGAASGVETTDGESTNTTASSDDGTDPTSTLAPFTPTTGPGSSTGDYEIYTSVRDSTGVITVDVPLDWSDIKGESVTEGGANLAAAPLLEGGYFDGFDVPGVSITVRPGISDDVDAVLDDNVDTDCTSLGREDYPLPDGRFEAFRSCGGTDTGLTHIAYNDRFRDVTVIIRVQILTSQDVNATNTIVDSLKLG